MAPQKLLSKQKTRQVVKVVDQVVKQEQSLEMVQSLMMISFTTICTLRDLIPLDALEDREFAFNTGQTRSKSSNPSKFKVLAPGKSRESDKLLNWLTGIKEALSKGYLASAQLSIIPRKDQQDHVVESYTFTFGYGHSSPDGGSSQPAVSSLNISQNHGTSVTVQSAKYELGKVIRYLVMLCQVMPALPDERYMTVHLFYNDDRPLGWDPDGFGPNNSNQMLMVKNGEWQPRSNDVGHSELGQHRVSVQTTYLLPTANDPGRKYKDFTIPGDLRFTESMERVQANIGKPMSLNALTDSADLQVPPGPAATQVNQKVAARTRTRGWTQSQSLHSSQPEVQTQTGGQMPPEIAEEGGAPLMNVRGGTMSLQSGVPPPNASQVSVRSQDVQIGARLMQMAKSNSELSEGFGSTQPVTGEFITAPDIDFRPEVGGRLMGMHNAASLPGGQDVTCECGIQTQEGLLVTCEFCDNLQHRCCYALETRDAAVQHVCYTCLLRDQDEERFNKMKHLARLRRLIWKIGKLGKHATRSELGRQIGCEQGVFTRLVDDLKRRGLIKELKKKDSPPFVIVDQQVVDNIKLSGLFHPLSGIDDLYCQVSNGKTMRVGPEAAFAQGSQADEAMAGTDEAELEVVRSDDETVDELNSLGPKTPVLQRRTTDSYGSCVFETPKQGRQLDATDSATMVPPAKRARYANSSQAMSPANVSRCD